MILVLEMLVAAAATGGLVLGMLRWLRVAQREHYHGGAAIRFAVLWSRVRPVNAVLGLLGALALLAALGLSWAGRSTAALVLGLVAGVASIGFPLGLSVRGRTSPLVATERLRRLALICLLIDLVVGALVGLASWSAPLGAVVAAVVVAPVVDLGCLCAAPLEARRAQAFVDRAGATLAAIAPRVVAITGSFGKTSTKNHVVQLIAGSMAVVATPASFNNQAGLARSVNEHLTPGTEVFVAEMGTYGPGEIAALCAWIPPEVAVLTAIGPVHLERFGSLEVTTSSKAEITNGARVVILNGDDPRLAALGASLAADGREVVVCSAIDQMAAVAVLDHPEGTVVCEHGEVVGGPFERQSGVAATNVACAWAVGRALGLSPADLAPRLERLAPAQNRQQAVVAASGVTVIDDTFNSNPTGAQAALNSLVRLDAQRRVVVTPGMVELGPLQAAENEAFGRACGAVADDLLVVGWTNRRALLRGAASTDVAVHVMADRPAAVAWVRANLCARDAVLYENDLPDNYP